MTLCFSLCFYYRHAYRICVAPCSLRPICFERIFCSYLAKLGVCFFFGKVVCTQGCSGFPHSFNLILLSVTEEFSEKLPQVCVTLRVVCLLLLFDYKKTWIQSTDFFTQVYHWESSHFMRILRQLDERHDANSLFPKLFCECALKQDFFMVWGCRHTIMLFHLNAGILLPKDITFNIFIFLSLICTVHCRSLKVNWIYIAYKDSVHTS